MESRTEAVDRVLEALSPVLAAELERIVAKAREALEAEFQKRLRVAVQDAKLAVETRTAQEAERAVEEARNSVRKQVSEELQARFARVLSENTSRVQQLQSKWDEERVRLEEQLQRWRVFAEAQRELAEAGSQPEILARFLRLSRPFARALAVYVVKADGLALWKSWGEHAFPAIISNQTRDPRMYFRTATVRGTMVGAVCAAPPCQSDALDFLTISLTHAIELFGLRLHAPVPKAAAAESAAAAAAGANASSGRASVNPEEELLVEARKLARLLISEIKLYNEQALREGRASSSIYERLRNEIDRGRTLYNRRSKSSARDCDYFHEELVRILADNNPELLGESYPGPSSS